MGQKAAKKKIKERVAQIDELSQAMQQLVSRMEQYNNNKQVDQLIKAHKLLMMDTRHDR